MSKPSVEIFHNICAITGSSDELATIKNKIREILNYSEPLDDIYLIRFEESPTKDQASTPAPEPAPTPTSPVLPKSAIPTQIDDQKLNYEIIQSNEIAVMFKTQVKLSNPDVQGSFQKLFDLEFEGQSVKPFISRKDDIFTIKCSPLRGRVEKLIPIFLSKYE